MALFQQLIANPSLFISFIITLIVAFTVHEFAHAWTATRFGDNTAKMNGRLTLNPLAHLDPIGTLLLFFAGFGYAKPVPVNPYALQRHSASAMMWVSLAGPLSNLSMAILASIPFWLGLVAVPEAGQIPSKILPSLSILLFVFISINISLMLFNLIPVAPLDGEKVLTYVLPPNLSNAWETIRPYGPIILMVIVFVLPYFGIDLLGIILRPAQQGLTNLLIP